MLTILSYSINYQSYGIITINRDDISTVMREQCISENMLVHVTIGIGSFRWPEKRKCNRVVADIPSVFRIIKDGHTPVRFWKVGPSVSAHLKLSRVPRRVPVCCASHVAELRVERCLLSPFRSFKLYKLNSIVEYWKSKWYIWKWKNIYDCYNVWFKLIPTKPR